MSRISRLAGWALLIVLGVIGGIAFAGWLIEPSCAADIKVHEDTTWTGTALTFYGGDGIFGEAEVLDERWSDRMRLWQYPPVVDTDNGPVECIMRLENN